MNDETAKKICMLMLDISVKLNESVHLAQYGAPPEEFSTYRAHVGSLIGHIYTDILSPLYREHPSLVPSELKQS